MRFLGGTPGNQRYTDFQEALRNRPAEAAEKPWHMRRSEWQDDDSPYHYDLREHLKAHWLTRRLASFAIVVTKVDTVFTEGNTLETKIWALWPDVPDVQAFNTFTKPKMTDEEFDLVQASIDFTDQHGLSEANTEDIEELDAILEATNARGLPNES